MRISTLLRVVASFFPIVVILLLVDLWTRELPLEPTHKLILIGSSVAIFGILLSAAENVRNREISRSEFHLRHSIDSLQKAENFLRDGNNNMVVWIAAARILERHNVVAASISERAHKEIYAIVVEEARRKFALFIGYEDLNKKGAFFYGSSPETDIDRAARESRRGWQYDSKYAHVTLAGDTKHIPEPVLYSIWNFCQYPVGYDDPLTDHQFSDEELRRNAVIYPGLVEYIRHKRRFPISGVVGVDEDDDEKCPPPDAPAQETGPPRIPPP